MKKIKKVLVRLIPENRKQLYIIYTMLFVITLIGSYLPFFLWNRSLIWEFDDGFYQHYGWLFQLKRIVKQFFAGNGFSFWSWSLGLGADINTMGSVSSVLCDPFNYVAIIFPERYLDIGMTVAIYFRLYVAGLGFLWFGKITKQCMHISLLGALAYSFSSWLFLCSTRHDTFVTAAVIFVFLMVGVEKILKQQSPFTFIVSAFFSAVTSLYFSYMSALLICIYLLIYFIKNEQKTLANFFKFFFRFLLYTLIVVLLAAIIIIPVIYTLLNAVKKGAIEYNILFDWNVYSNYIVSFAAGNEVFYHFSTFSASALFLIMVPPVVVKIRHKRETVAMLMFCCCLFFMLFPLINAVFNGIGYPVGRWCYGMTFFFIWSGLQCLEEREYIINLKKPVYGFLVFLGVWLVIVCRVILRINSELNLILGIINISIGFWMYNIIVSFKQLEIKRMHYLLTLVLVLNFTIIHSIEGFQKIFSYQPYGVMYDKVTNSTQKAGTEISDETFYRIDQKDYIQGGDVPAGYVNKPDRFVHVPPNETLIHNTRSLYSYNSTMPDYQFTFNKDLCNNASYFKRVATYNNDNRARLDFLMGVKYFLGDNPCNYPENGADEFAGYGFSVMEKSSGGVNILETKYSMGLGCIFDSYITQSEWLSLGYIDREQALMECVVLSDDRLETGLLHKDVSTISSNAQTLYYDVDDTTDIIGANGTALSRETLLLEKSFKIEKENSGFTINIDTNMEDCEVYLMFKNLKRNTEIKQLNDSLGKLGILRDKFTTSKDYGEFSICADNGVIAKKAFNTNGIVTGFSDITDFMINMGVNNKGSNKIEITFDHAGMYTFDDFQVMLVPLNLFRDSANICMNNSFEIEIAGDDYICGRVNLDSTSIEGGGIVFINSLPCWLECLC